MSPVTRPVTRDLLVALPKTDLHCHLDGSVRASTLLELADADGVSLGVTTEGALRDRLSCGRVRENLADYLAAFEITLRALQSESALSRAAYELVEDAAAENVRYIEVRYAPILHTTAGLPLPSVVEAVCDGLERGQRDFGVRWGVILCGIRNMEPITSLRIAELAVAFKHAGVVGFDLAGAEVDHPAKKHVEAFRLILQNNVNCTLHAGEAYGPESIHQAIHYCGAHRIGHGVRLKEDGDLLNYVNDRRIPLEVCPSSNVQTRAVPSLESHPLRFYFDLGVRVTVNTDNRLMTDTTVTDELLRVHRVLGFELEEIARLILNGFKSAFLPFRERRALLEDARREIEALSGVALR